MTPHFTKYSIPQKQTGAALITSLVFLVILTLLGVSSMTSSTLEEKIAGNMLNKQASFQAAEAALREGEQDIENNALTDNSNSRGADQAEGTVLDNGYNPRSIASHAGYPLWENMADADWTQGTAINGIPDNPVYTIEQYGTAPRDENCGLDPTEASTCQSIIVYRVTAKGTGLNDNAETLLQSIYYKQ